MLCLFLIAFERTTILCVFYTVVPVRMIQIYRTSVKHKTDLKTDIGIKRWVLQWRFVISDFSEPLFDVRLKKTLDRRHHGQLTISVVKLARASSTVAAIFPPLSSFLSLPRIGVLGKPKKYILISTLVFLSFLPFFICTRKELYSE